MSTFYLNLKQASEGCDYSIGCGQKLVCLSASTLADARAEAACKIIDYGDAEDEISEAEIMEVVDTHVVDVDTIMNTYKASLLRDKKDAARDVRRQQYEAGKKEFGGE